jgi:hypothetical protein
MRLFLCESGGQHAIVRAPDEARALRLVAEAEIRLVLPRTDPEWNIAEFIGGWRVRELELDPDAEEGIQLAWWSTLPEVTGEVHTS